MKTQDRKTQEIMNSIKRKDAPKIERTRKNLQNALKNISQLSTLKTNPTALKKIFKNRNRKKQFKSFDLCTIVRELDFKKRRSKFSNLQKNWKKITHRFSENKIITTNSELKKRIRDRLKVKKLIERSLKSSRVLSFKKINFVVNEHKKMLKHLEPIYQVDDTCDKLPKIKSKSKSLPPSLSSSKKTLELNITKIEAKPKNKQKKRKIIKSLENKKRVKRYENLERHIQFEKNKKEISVKKTEIKIRDLRGPIQDIQKDLMLMFKNYLKVKFQKINSENFNGINIMKKIPEQNNTNSKSNHWFLEALNCKALNHKKSQEGKDMRKLRKISSPVRYWDLNKIKKGLNSHRSKTTIVKGYKNNFNYDLGLPFLPYYRRFEKPIKKRRALTQRLERGRKRENIWQLREKVATREEFEILKEEKVDLIDEFESWMDEMKIHPKLHEYFGLREEISRNEHLRDKLKGLDSEKKRVKRLKRLRLKREMRKRRENSHRLKNILMEDGKNEILDSFDRSVISRRTSRNQYKYCMKDKKLFNPEIEILQKIRKQKNKNNREKKTRKIRKKPSITTEKIEEGKEFQEWKTDGKEDLFFDDQDLNFIKF